ncbi:hypothetical protein Q4F19_12815 [Sphingomonas sp. BIUV-7]|uniref:Right handed beta helix domain-containing protein n=1 Tax=Sphingomonas natans TaxID=3063330 RepID=A0ABT8YAA7_9SPHN|nr:hypothetical protein [Sphingomonas sp. BIUV-7]MDO6415267.1 hypothetical protein [Sphingomonas sp. BIUV-7]
MNRRDFMTVASVGVGVATLPALRAEAQGVQTWPNLTTLYLDPESGNDSYSGAKTSPLRSLAEAARRVNMITAPGPVTIILKEGVYAIEETARLHPEGRLFSKTDRLTIRAEILPDDPQWDMGRMPTLIHTLPLKKVWDGRFDGAGGTVDGILVEMSHVSVMGLRFLGLPVVETPRAKLLQRVYGISRFGKNHEDLEIGHCVFAGDIVTSPFHVCIIARGNEVNVHHCIFHGVKITVVYWQPETTGHSMTNCVVNGAYGSGVWTSSIDDRYVFHNNVIANSNYVWTWQNARTATGDVTRVPTGAGAAPPPAATPEVVTSRYKVASSYFAANRHMAGSGTGARLGYIDLDPAFLQMENTKVTNMPIEFETDQSKRDYLAPVAGSDAAKVGAGLFARP